MIEESASLVDEDPFLGLDKAKEAVDKVQDLSDHCQEHSITILKTNDLTFTTKFHLAVLYEKNGMNHEAIESYSSLLKEYKHEANLIVRIRVNLGNLYCQQRRFKEALKNYQMAMDQTTRDEKALRFRIQRTIGNILNEIGQVSEAILEYEAISVNSEADLEACFNLLLCHVQNGNIAKSKQTFLRMLTITKPLYKKGQSSKQKHVDTDEGGPDTILQKTTVTLVTAARVICSQLYPDEQWKEGYMWVKEEAKKRKMSIVNQIDLNLALEHLKRGNYNEATNIMKSFETKDIEMTADIATNLSFLYFLEGDFAIADEYVELALSSNRFNAKALVNKGNSLFVVEKYEQAKELYLEAMGVDPTHYEAMFNLGLTCTRLGQYQEALQVFGRLNTISTNDVNVLYHIGSANEQNGNERDALKWFNVLSACAPTDARIMHRIGSIHSDQGDDGQSLHFHAESNRLEPWNVDVVGFLAIAYVKNELYEKALDFFQKAAALQPNEVNWILMCGSSLRKIGRLEEAFEMYLQANNIEPENIECLRYLIRTGKDLGKDTKLFEDAMLRVDVGSY